MKKFALGALLTVAMASGSYAGSNANGMDILPSKFQPVTPSMSMEISVTGAGLTPLSSTVRTI